jgi:hypothetical protein
MVRNYIGTLNFNLNTNFILFILNILNMKFILATAIVAIKADDEIKLDFGDAFKNFGEKLMGKGSEFEKAMSGADAAMACLKLKDLQEMTACTAQAKWGGKNCADQTATDKEECTTA